MVIDEKKNNEHSENISKESTGKTEQDIIFAYCPLCKANYDDYPESKCLCHLKKDDDNKKDKENENEISQKKIRKQTPDFNTNDSGDKGLCNIHNTKGKDLGSLSGLENIFDAKIQNIDTPGDTCLSKSETISGSRIQNIDTPGDTCLSKIPSSNDLHNKTVTECNYPSINVFLEENCVTDVPEAVGLSTVCAITGNILEGQVCNSIPRLPETSKTPTPQESDGKENKCVLGLRTSKTSLLREIGEGIQAMGNKLDSIRKRSFDVFIVDREGNMDTYEMSKINAFDGPKIIVNKKECKCRHQGLEGKQLCNLCTRRKESMDKLPPCSGGTGVCKRCNCNKESCNGICNKEKVYSEQESEESSLSTNTNDQEAFDMDRRIFVKDRQGEIVNFQLSGDVSRAHKSPSGPTCRITELRQSKKSGDEPGDFQEYMKISKSGGFNSTIIFEEGSTSPVYSHTFKGSKIGLRTGSKVARLIRFYEKLSSKENGKN